MTHLTRKTIALFFTLAFMLIVSPILASAASPFKDVKTTHSAYAAIEWAYQEGIIKGYPNGTFAPDRTVTEAQFVDMLIRFDCSAANSAKASTASNYRYLQDKNIPVNGTSNVKARDLPITKGQVARIAAAFQGVDLSETRAVQYLYKNDLANGATGKNDYKDYGANLSMTRADAVVFLQRLSNSGNCDMIGLSRAATGSDDKTIKLPPAFLGTGTVTFNPPEVNTQPPVITQPTVPPVTDTGKVAGTVDIDIEKPKLIANGVDSTFVTVSFNGCTNGRTIDYEDSMSFTAKSALGALIDSSQTDTSSTNNLAEATLQADLAEAKLAEAIKAAGTARAALNDLLAKQENQFAKEREQVKETEGLVVIAISRVAEAQKVVDAAAAHLEAVLKGSLAGSKPISPEYDGVVEFYLEGGTIINPVTDARNRLEAAVRLAEIAEANLVEARKNAEAAVATLNNSIAQLPASDKALVVDAQNRLKEAELAVTTAETQAKDARAKLAAARAQANSKPSNTTSMTDGPEMTVKVTAPASSIYRTDTLTFQLLESNCNSNPITVNLDYAPQAELRLEEFSESLTANANGTTTRIKATVVRPGGLPLTNSEGRIRFRSTQGTSLSDEYVQFVNGVAWVTVTSPATTYSITDEITAEFETMDPRYKDELASIVNTTHRIKVTFEPPLQIDKSCTFTAPEVAFILDSSGSMKRSDPNRLRVTKSQELINALNMPKNIASHFNSSGKMLYPEAAAVSAVSPTFINVNQSGGTNIASGLKIAFDKFTPGNEPKVAILLTDGKSNEQKVLDLLTVAKEKKIKIYTIGLGSEKQINESLLQKLAKETGGHYYHVAESSQLGTAYQAILSAITCDIPAGPACTLSSEVFTSPTLKTVGDEFFMNTYVNDNCGKITRVVLRFNSTQGDIDYELAYRNQGYFALKKGTYEITNFHLLQEGTFRAFNANGELVGEKKVEMQ